MTDCLFWWTNSTGSSTVIDVVLAAGVELGHKGGEGGRLARAHRARDEKQAIVVIEQFLDRIEVAQA